MEQLKNANERIQFRTTPNDKALLQQAAELSGFRNLSDFVRWCAINKAREVIPKEVHELSALDSAKVAEYLLSNPEANQALRDLMQNKDK